MLFNCQLCAIAYVKMTEKVMLTTTTYLDTREKVTVMGNSIHSQHNKPKIKIGTVEYICSRRSVVK